MSDFFFCLRNAVKAHLGCESGGMDYASAHLQSISERVFPARASLFRAERMVCGGCGG